MDTKDSFEAELVQDNLETDSFGVLFHRDNYVSRQDTDSRHEALDSDIAG